MHPEDTCATATFRRTAKQLGITEVKKIEWRGHGRLFYLTPKSMEAIQHHQITFDLSNPPPNPSLLHTLDEQPTAKRVKPDNFKESVYH